MGIFRQYYGISDKVKENGYSGFMERFPILFQNKDKPMTETCMCWGIECPIGWYYILEQLCTELEYSNMESVPDFLIWNLVQHTYQFRREGHVPRQVL